MKILLNILKNISTNQNFIIFFMKIIKRLEKNDSDLAYKWAKENITLSTEQFCRKIDNSLYEKIIIDIKSIEQISRSKLKDLKLDLGGGGNYILLYFLIRKYKPSVVIETGVAAGWSSLSILQAMEKNNKGNLYSSDFPYFRLKNPKKYIGYLVKNSKLKSRWNLNTQGDARALPIFLNLIKNKKIDLFHYDSDKSYSGRSFAYNILKKNFTNKSIIIYDDIQDNLHFRDFVNKNSLKFKVLEFEKKFVGIIGA